MTSNKDLGIVLGYNIYFFLCNNVFIKKYFKMLRFINRNTNNLKIINALKTLFFFLIISHLEFEPIIWLSFLLYKNKLKMLNRNVQNYYIIHLIFPLQETCIAYESPRFHFTSLEEI